MGPLSAAALVVFAGFMALSALLVRDAWRLIKPSDYVHPLDVRSYPTDPRKAYGLSFDDVSLPTPSGDLLSGWLVRAGRGSEIVVAVHGRGGNRRQFLPLAPALIRADISILLLDLRENGLSGGAGRGMTMGAREAEDVVLATRAMRSAGFAKVVALGCSLGGAAVLRAGARELAIAGVAADSSPADFPTYVADMNRVRMRKLGLAVPDGPLLAWGKAVTDVAATWQGAPTHPQPVEAAPLIAPRPLLVVTGEDDHEVEPEHARRLAAAAHDPKTLWVAPGAGHCESLKTHPDEYADKIIDLVRRS